MGKSIVREIDFGDKIVEGVQKAIDKMLLQKARDGKEVVIAGSDGLPKHVKASDLLKKKK